MRLIILRLTHDLSLVVRSRERRMYDTLIREYYRPNISTDIYYTFRPCDDCHQIGTKFSQVSHLQLFSPSDPLEITANYFNGKLPQTKSHNRFVVIVTDPYCKLTRTIRIPKISSTHNNYILFNNFVPPHGISNIIPSDNGQQLFCKFFISLCNYLCGKK